MCAEPTHRQQAETLAIALARGQLAAKTDWPARRARLGLLTSGDASRVLRLAFFGKTLELHLPACDAVIVETGKPPKPADLLLVLHYLLCDQQVVPEDRWISFREFPGGAFYWQPFLARSVVPLITVIGNDRDRLRERLTRFAGRIEPGPADALTARITAISRIEVLLIYRCGDDEFPPSADLLYDACARRVYGAEDAAALAGRVCLGLL